MFLSQLKQEYVRCHTLAGGLFPEPMLRWTQPALDSGFKEAGTGESDVQGYWEAHDEYEVNLGYMRLSHRTRKNSISSMIKDLSPSF